MRPDDCAGSGPVLVVDDDPGLLDLIAMRLESGGFRVTTAASGEAALAAFRAERPRVVITDLRMAEMDGHALFAQLKAEAPTLPVIMLTAHGTIPDAVAATREGAYAFLTKPFDGRELLQRVSEAMALSPPVDRSAASADGWLAGLSGASPLFTELLRQARRAADLDTPLLITGPRGAGKATLARAIHAASRRSGGPFVVLDGGREPDREPADPGGRLAAALAAAHGGCLLVDDVDGLDAAEQLRLLAIVVEAPLFSAARAAAPDLRIVATAPQGIDAAIRDGEFRADLYYALGRTVLEVPALHLRRDDIALLAAEFASATGIPRTLAPEAVALLRDADWPGNVAQLRSVVGRAVARAVTPVVPASLVRALLNEDDTRELAPLDEARRAFEHDYLCRLMEVADGNVTRAARIAQRNRTEFYKLLARHGIDPARYKR